MRGTKRLNATQWLSAQATQYAKSRSSGDGQRDRGHVLQFAAQLVRKLRERKLANY